MPEKKGEQDPREKNKNRITRAKIRITEEDLLMRYTFYVQIVNNVCGPCDENGDDIPINKTDLN